MLFVHVKRIVQKPTLGHRVNTPSVSNFSFQLSWPVRLGLSAFILCPQMDGEEAINETAAGKTVTTTTSTTIAAVHGTGPAAPRMRAMICSVGSTIRGHVTASADNVHPR